MSDVFGRAQLQELLDTSPFSHFLGLQIVAIDVHQSSVTVMMPARPETMRSADSNQFHGGALAAAIDTVGDLAVSLVVGGGVPTIDVKIDYLRPASGASMHVSATARRVGRTIAFADIEIHDPDGKLCALGRGVYLAKTG